jgi:hypothetical protein
MSGITIIDANVAREYGASNGQHIPGRERRRHSRAAALKIEQAQTMATNAPPLRGVLIIA